MLAGDVVVGDEEERFEVSMAKAEQIGSFAADAEMPRHLHVMSIAYAIQALSSHMCSEHIDVTASSNSECSSLLPCLLPLGHP
jgi:hypothetical protein